MRSEETALGLAKLKGLPMSEPRKIDVAYADGHWLAEVDFYSFDCPNLMTLIKTVPCLLPDEELIFIVDQSTVEDYVAAEAQFVEASTKSGALVISSFDV
jgi:hypothetical protein